MIDFNKVELIGYPDKRSFRGVLEVRASTNWTRFKRKWKRNWA